MSTAVISIVMANCALWILLLLVVLKRSIRGPIYNHQPVTVQFKRKYNYNSQSFCALLTLRSDLQDFVQQPHHCSGCRISSKASRLSSVVKLNLFKNSRTQSFIPIVLGKTKNLLVAFQANYTKKNTQLVWIKLSKPNKLHRRLVLVNTKWLRIEGTAGWHTMQFLFSLK